MILSIILLSVFLCGFAVMFVGLRNAPGGDEADGEFHILWRNNAPDVSNIVCIWSGEKVEPVTARSRRRAA